MTAVICLLTAAAFGGVEAGWQPLDSSGVEYIVRIDPESAEELKAKGITHDVSPKVADIRRILVFVGQGKLPTVPAKNAAPGQIPIRDPASVIRISAESLKQLETEGVLVELQENERDVGRIQVFIGAPPTTSTDSDKGVAKPDGAQSPRPAGETTDQGPRFGQVDDNRAVSEVPVVPIAPNPPGDNRPSGPPRTKSEDKAAAGNNAPPWAIDANKKSPAPQSSALQPKPHTGSWAKERSPSDPKPVEDDTVTKANIGNVGGGEKTPNGSRSTDSTATGKSSKSSNDEPSRPWLPLTVSLLALFASIGGNVYLGWLHLESRAKYRRLLERLQNQPTTV